MDDLTFGIAIGAAGPTGNGRRDPSMIHGISHGLYGITGFKLWISMDHNHLHALNQTHKWDILREYPWITILIDYMDGKEKTNN